MTRETGMATKADLKRIKHRENCQLLANGKTCRWCRVYGYRYWKCRECGVIGYTDGIESHTCPGQIHEPKDCEEYARIAKQPECKKCWDKGYRTELNGGTSASGPILIIRFCICHKGKLAQRRKKSITIFESKTYKLPIDFKKLTEIKINGKDYGRYQGNSTQFNEKSRGCEAKRAATHARKKSPLS